MMQVFWGFVFLAILIFIVPQSFAQEEPVLVSIPKNTSTPDCQKVDLCYIPSPLTVQVGDVVMWTNYDSVDHTVTSGSPKDGPDGIIYSNLINPGKKFAFSFDKSGSYSYYCILHPWMEGLVLVKAVKVDIENKFELTEKRITSDGSIMIEIKTDIPKARHILPIELRFTDKNNNLLEHMNYDIKIIQDNEEFLFIENAQAIDGTSEHVTRSLETDHPVDIEIGIRGIYPYSAPEQSIKEVIKFAQVPEFGTISMMILGIATVSIIIFTRFTLSQNGTVPHILTVD